MKMDEEALRMECLKLAIGHQGQLDPTPKAIVAAAEKYAAFVRPGLEKTGS